MAVERFLIHLAAEHAGRRLDQALAAALPQALGAEISRRAVRRLIAAGAVHVNRKRLRVASRTLAAGASIEVYVDRQLLAGAVQQPEPPALRVLWEDAHLIAVDKPAGLPVQATRSDAVHHLEALVRRRLATQGGGPRPYLALHQRLDSGTSGIVVLAKSRAANAGLARVFANRQVSKLYRAVVVEDVEAESESTWTVECRLDKVVDRDGQRRIAVVEEGGRQSQTHFERFGSAAGRCFVDARPVTGRTHQIRVHLAASGLPVWGDSVYGVVAGASRLMLHAWQLEVEHPLSGELLSLESDLPADFAPPERSAASAATVKGGSVGLEPDSADPQLGGG